MAWPKGKKRPPETVRKIAETRRRNAAAGVRKPGRPRKQVRSAMAREIDPLGYSDLPETKRQAAPPVPIRSRLRSLDAQATALVEQAIGLRRQITQIAQELEA